MQQQAEGIGQEAVTAQAVGAETVLELLDAVLTLAAIVVPRDFGGVSGGGVWQVYLYWAPSTGEIDWKMSLHGLAFFQLPIIAERRTIRCHGPESIRAALRLIPH